MTIALPAAQLERLRREAKKLARELDITHTQALDRRARQQGFQNWSLLSKHTSPVGCVAAPAAAIRASRSKRLAAEAHNLGVRSSAMKKKVFLTFAKADDENLDITYCAQQLERAGLEVRRYDWFAQAGDDLWRQIDQEISSPDRSDAWVMLVSARSLQSAGCREELSYALRRALDMRNAHFPLIGLLDTRVTDDLLPSAIAVRGYVTLKDENWVERVVAAVEGRDQKIQLAQIDPFVVKVHRTPEDPMHKFVVEVRPRVGVWSPCFVGVPIGEASATRGMLLVTAFMGPATRPGERSPRSPMMIQGMTLGNDPVIRAGGEQFVCRPIQEEATPSRSVFAYFSRLPSKVAFGRFGAEGSAFVCSPIDAAAD